ncbi:hypothetical protein KY328_00025 [Candidatus Woesearchaeota archaeon]|nr:hypothetical protein [Candidatus Woesearchaeota archaeon]
MSEHVKRVKLGFKRHPEDRVIIRKGFKRDPVKGVRVHLPRPGPQICASGRFSNARRRGFALDTINIYQTPGVRDSELASAFTGIERFIDELGLPIKIEIKVYPDESLRKALTPRNLGYGPQLDCSVIADLLSEEDLFKLVLVSNDLYTGRPDNNFIYGQRHFPNAVMSVRRMQHLDEDLKHESIAQIAAHEFGHNLDLVGRNYNSGTQGYTIKHCAGEKGPCLMEQVDVPGCKTSLELVQLLTDRYLCPDCTHEIKYRMEELK